MVNSDILRVHTYTIILNILSQGDSYGYEIARSIHTMSEGIFEIKDATIYTAFRRLEAEGYIDTYWGDGVGGARRRYYKITIKGRKAYAEMVNDWKITSRVLNILIGGDK